MLAVLTPAAVVAGVVWVALAVGLGAAGVVVAWRRLRAVGPAPRVRVRLRDGRVVVPVLWWAGWRWCCWRCCRRVQVWEVLVLCPAWEVEGVLAESSGRRAELWVVAGGAPAGPDVSP